MPPWKQNLAGQPSKGLPSAEQNAFGGDIDQPRGTGLPRDSNSNPTPSPDPNDTTFNIDVSSLRPPYATVCPRDLIISPPLPVEQSVSRMPPRRIEQSKQVVTDPLIKLSIPYTVYTTKTCTR